MELELHVQMQLCCVQSHELVDVRPLRMALLQYHPQFLQSQLEQHQGQDFAMPHPIFFV